MLPWISPPRMAREVVAGHVTCPRGDATVDIARCQACPYLDDVVVVDGAIVEITCAPSFGSLAAAPLGARIPA